MKPATALIGWGQVRHTRHRPAHHAFVYPTAFLMLPMRCLQAGQGAQDLAINRRAWFAFHDADHGDGRSVEQGGALAWLDELLQHEGIHDATGEVWLQAFPRVLGHAFKPVSFWYAHRADGSLAAIVAEVNNTFGERHCYLLRGENVRWGQELVADKIFHVSPFCAVEGQYRFRFMRTADRMVARIDLHDDQGPLLKTSISGHLEPFTRHSARRAFWGTPLMTLGVVARIHWHALRLFLKRVPFFHKPAAPERFVSR